MMLRASAYGMGTTAMVPLMVPVTFPGYRVAIGLGEDSTVVGKIVPFKSERSRALHGGLWGAAWPTITRIETRRRSKTRILKRVWNDKRL